MEIHEIAALMLAKLDPNYAPALLAEMKQSYDTVTQNAKPEVIPKYIEMITSMEVLVEMVVKGKLFDIVLVDQDLDETGYGTLGTLRHRARTFSARQVALNDTEAQLRQDAEHLLKDLPYKNGEIFRYNYLAEWNAVFRLLERAKLNDNPERIKRLGLEADFGYMERCHELLGQLLGVIAPTDDSQKVGLGRFEEARTQFLSIVITSYPTSSDEDRRWRTTLVGPLQRHVALYRADRLKQEKARQEKEEKEKKKQEPSEADFVDSQ